MVTDSGRLNPVSASDRVSLEMGLTHRDFFRLLPRATRHAPVVREGNRLTVSAAVGQVTITLGPETARRLASLKAPVTEVTLEFIGFSPPARAAFLKRFDLAFRKGGG